jgi:hypothetical protein
MELRHLNKWLNEVYCTTILFPDDSVNMLTSCKKQAQVIDSKMFGLALKREYPEIEILVGLFVREINQVPQKQLNIQSLVRCVIYSKYTLSQNSKSQLSSLGRRSLWLGRATAEGEDFEKSSPFPRSKEPPVDTGDQGDEIHLCNK